MNVLTDFVTARRVSLHSVKAYYVLKETGVEFSVHWSNINENDGSSYDSYYLSNDAGLIECDDDDAKKSIDALFRIMKAIRLGESDDNDDIELYLELRDTFNMVDAKNYSDYKYDEMMLNREKAVKAVGEEAVNTVDALKCQFLHRVMNDDTAEFTARVYAKYANGYDVVLIAHYFVEAKSLTSMEQLEKFDWKVAGYSIVLKEDEGEEEWLEFWI